jgi:hypothetical protein
MLTVLTLSAMVPPSDAAQLIQLLDILQNDGPIFTIQGQNMGLARLRPSCAFSATQLWPKTLSSRVINASSTCPLRFNLQV